MRQGRQRSVQRCACGGVQQVTATASAYEFTYACVRCPRAGVVSWAHAHPPPQFVAEAVAPLFDPRISAPPEAPP